MEITGMALPAVMSILLVEDSPVNRDVAQVFLSRAGHQVVLCDSGEQALHRLAADHFDLILMDVRMPGLDGVETTRRMRALADPVKANTPILALTASDHPDDFARCLAAGMNGFLLKPLRLASFKRAIAALIEGEAVRLPAEPANPADPLLDRERLDLLSASFPEGKLAELFDIAQGSIRESASGLKQAWRDQDRPSVVHFAHRLAGAAGNFACPALATIAAAIETDCRTGGDGHQMAFRFDCVLEETLAALAAAR